MRRTSYERKKQWIAYLFLMPWMIGMIFFFIQPFIESLIYSFSVVEIKPGELIVEWVGFENYKKAFLEDPNVKKAIIESSTSVLYQVPLVTIFSMFVATLLNQKFRGRMFMRAVFFMPVIIAGSMVIPFINGDAFSNAILEGTRGSTMFEVHSISMMLKEVGINSNVVESITKIINDIFNLSWRSGIPILLFLASLQSIPHSFYEVAEIDGANKWVCFWKVTFPMMTPIMMTVIVYTTIDGFIDSANPLVQIIYNASNTLDIPYASALAWINMIITLVIVGVIYKVLNSKVSYYVE